MSTLTADKISPDERAERLANAVNYQVSQGWRVASQTQTQAQLVKGKKTSHGLHIFLGFVTLGLWWITVWPAVAILGGEKSKFIAVDEYGQVTIT